jgi:hypothetical protein
MVVVADDLLRGVAVRSAIATAVGLATSHGGAVDGQTYPGRTVKRLVPFRPPHGFDQSRPRGLWSEPLGEVAQSVVPETMPQTEPSEGW